VVLGGADGVVLALAGEELVQVFEVRLLELVRQGGLPVGGELQLQLGGRLHDHRGRGGGLGGRGGHFGGRGGGGGRVRRHRPEDAVDGRGHFGGGRGRGGRGGGALGGLGRQLPVDRPLAQLLQGLVGARERLAAEELLRRQGRGVGRRQDGV